MISANRNSLTYPLVDDLYWLSPGRDGAPLYSPASFYFVSADGSRLVPAMSDEPRFLAALATEINNLTGFACAPGLQTILDALEADNTPPAPRYPAVGDTGVYGRAKVFGDEGPNGFGAVFFWYQQTNVPDWYLPSVPRNIAQQSWSRRFPIWAGWVDVSIGDGNSYSTPDANLVASGSTEIGVWRYLQFKQRTPVTSGRVRFDIIQKPELYAPTAINVVNV